MAHSYSKETILHFTCESCKNWWSYATTEDYVPKKVHCSHCGLKSDAMPKSFYGNNIANPLGPISTRQVDTAK